MGLVQPRFDRRRRTATKAGCERIVAPDAPRYLLLYLAIVGVVAWLFMRLPSAFLPSEDQGYFINSITLPVGATQQRTLAVLKQIEQYYFNQPEVADVIDVAGFSFNGQAQNSALAFVHLETVERAVRGRAFGAGNHRPRVCGAGPDPRRHHLPVESAAHPGTGRGFGLRLRAGGPGRSGPRETHAGASNQLLGSGRENPAITQLQMQGLEDTPELKVDVDQTKAAALGVPLAALNATLTACFGSVYINNFVNGNRVERVIAQLDAPYRMLPQDLGKTFVRSSNGTHGAAGRIGDHALDLRLAGVAALQRISFA